MTKPTGAWVIGHNLAGYLPESDTYAYAEWTDAADALKDEMEQYADQDDDATSDHLAATAVLTDYPDYANSGYGDDEPSMLAQVKAIYADQDGPRDGQGWSALLTDGRDRHIAFWLQWEPTRDPDADEDYWPYRNADDAHDNGH